MTEKGKRSRVLAQHEQRTEGFYLKMWNLQHLPACAAERAFNLPWHPTAPLGEDWLRHIYIQQPWLPVHNRLRLRLFEIDELGKLKKCFATYGISYTFHSNDGPPFNSNEFAAFAAMYEFEHVTSSLEYPQSNGKVENAVKTSKNLMKKAATTNLDFQLALLDWRNTPTEGMKSSPAQRMFGRRTRTLLPTSKELLEPQLVRDVRERKLQRKEAQTRYFNRKVKELLSLTEGDVVRMKPQVSDGKQRWAKAQVQQQVDVRSYAVRTEDGRLFRRNHRHLQQSKEQFVAKDVDVKIPSPVTNCPPTEVYIEPYFSSTSTEQHKRLNTPLGSKETGQGPPIIRPTLSSDECQKNSAVTRSGRSVRPPGY